ncbi:MAG: GntR family transcriptional regulator [Pseudomonadota bacterium]
MANQLNLKPVDASFSLKDHIYEVLKTSIMDLDIYDPETNLRMDERTLAEQLGISRTPIREAIMRLEQEGFVDIQPRRGVFIRRKSLTEIVEMITVWAALESMAARLACTEATDTEIDGLREIAGRYSTEAAKAHLGDYAEANIEFHLAILRLSKNAMLQKMAESLFPHLKAVRRQGMADITRADRSVEDHADIVQAIGNREADAAARLVREHTLRLNDYIRLNWKNVVAGRTPG